MKCEHCWNASAARWWNGVHVCARCFVYLSWLAKDADGD